MIKGKCHSFPFISTSPEIIAIKLNCKQNKVQSETGFH
jgi:hypothetical protein